MFIFLDKKRDQLNQWLKNKTTMDFSDWGVFLLFIIGICAIFYFDNGTDTGNKISSVVLWFTAVVILQYTKETYWLKQISQKTLGEMRKQTNLEMKPYIKLSWLSGERTIEIRNIGKGIARQIELKFYAEEGDKESYYNNLGCEKISALASGESERASFYDKSTILKVDRSDESFIFHIFPEKPDGHGYKVIVSYTEIDQGKKHEATFRTSWTNKDKFIIEEQ